MKLKFKEANGNPWRRNLPDCIFRSMALAFNLNYKTICDMFHVKCIPGLGISTDVWPTTEEIINIFDDWFDTYETDDIYYDNYASYIGKLFGVPDAEYDDKYVDPDKGFTIQEHVDKLAMPKGLYIYWIRPTREQLSEPGCSPEWHSTFVNLKNNTLYDTFDCINDGVVFGWAKVKESKIIPNKSQDPLSWLLFAHRINRGYYWGKRIPKGWTKEKWIEYQKLVEAKDKTRPNVFKTFPF